MYHGFDGLKQVNQAPLYLNLIFGKHADMIRQYCFLTTDGSISDSNIMPYVIIASCVLVIIGIEQYESYYSQIEEVKYKMNHSRMKYLRIWMFDVDIQHLRELFQFFQISCI